MTQLDFTAEPSLATRLRLLVSDSLVIVRRSLAHVRQIPEKLIDVTLHPLMLVPLFGFVFGGVIAVPGGDYREYLIRGILVQTLAFGMVDPRPRWRPTSPRGLSIASEACRCRGPRSCSAT